MSVGVRPSAASSTSGGAGPPLAPSALPPDCAGQQPVVSCLAAALSPSRTRQRGGRPSQAGKATLALRHHEVPAPLRQSGHIGWHDLRPISGSHLAMKGAALKVSQERMGHATLKMMMRSAHLRPKATRDAVQLLDAPGHYRSNGSRVKKGRARNPFGLRALSCGGGGNRTRRQGDRKPQAGRAVTRYRLDLTSVRCAAPSRLAPSCPVLIPAGGAH
jgi:hypothetical protein